MVKKQKHVEAAPVVVAPEATEPKAKPVRYAALPVNFDPAKFVVTVNMPNQKRGASKGRYDLYQSGQLASQYLDACVQAGFKRAKGIADLRWDTQRGFISLNPVE